MKSLIALSVIALLLFGCTGGKSAKVNDEFPDTWWEAIPEKDLASWEIPPQAADRSKGEVVLSKRNKLGQFSNFSATPFTLDGKKYASIEGLWQSMKYPEGKNDERLKNKKIKWPHKREEVMQLTGLDAKKAGEEANEIMEKLGIKWVTYNGKKLYYVGQDKDKHYDIILRATRAKLEENPNVLQLLLKTKNLKLMADHKQKPDAPPAYKYQEIYTLLREEFRNRTVPVPGASIGSGDISK